MDLFGGLGVAAAASNTVQTVTDALGDALSTAGSDMLGMISTMVPVVIPVMIGITAVGVGIKVFKKIIG